MSNACKVTCSSPEGLTIFSNLAPIATILLFTPVLLPAKEAKTTPEKTTIDPFEAFGRALSQQHKRIRHVPYVPKNGYTDTHAAFLSQADATITVICEPDRDKTSSTLHQLQFAGAVRDATEDKEANAATSLVLVQCASEQHGRDVTDSFVNVIEAPYYDVDIAKVLARTIFSCKS